MKNYYPLLVLLLTFQLGLSQTTYYVDATSGNDSSDGLTAATAWQSIAKVNAESYQPGDFILFKSGEEFFGKLIPSTNGSHGKQITYGKYGGTTKPIINGRLYNACIDASGKEYLTFTDLELVNSGEFDDPADVIDDHATTGAEFRRYGFYMNSGATGAPRRSIVLNNLEIHKIYPISIQGSDYKGYGILMTGFGASSGNIFDGVTISNCEIYDVPQQGIGINKWGNQPIERHKNITIRDNYIHNTGSSGIILFEVNGYLIERNTITWTGDYDYNPVAWYDGKMRNRGSGFWCVRTNDGLLQYNEFSHARGPADSCGAHIDIENDNVIIQYNLSYDNAGGFAEFMGANTNCAYRYNVSINDGWRVKRINNTYDQATYPEMYTQSGAANFQEGKAVWFSDYYGCSTCKVPSVGNAVHNNTIYTNSYTGYWGGTDPVHALVKVEEGSAENVVKNNIFYMDNGSTLSYEEEAGVGSGNVFRDNLYSDAGPPGGLFGHSSDIDNADPLFVNKGSTNPDDYRIQLGSPAIDSGHHIQVGATTDDYPGGAGGMDYWGTFIDNTTGSIDIGAHETDGCSNNTTYNGSWNNGFPDSNDLVTIDADYTTADDGGSFDACQVIISDGATLTVSAGDYINVNTNIIVKGTLNVEATGSVVQVDEDAVTSNQGMINVNLTTPTLGSRDFMVLGVPMDWETRNHVWADGFLVLDHETTNFVPNAAVAAQFPGAENFADDNYDDWSPYNSRFNPGEGYIVRPQAGYGEPGGVFNYTYDQGTLNSGLVEYEADYNGTQNGSPNVIANPYPSAITASSLISANSMIDAVYFWEHLQPPSTNIPGAGSMNFSMENISMRNGTGGLAATITQGVGAGNTSSNVPSDFIATGQGFGFKASAAGTVQFTNSMRVTGNNTDLRSPDKNRIWIGIGTGEHNLYRTALIGFMDEATAGYDAGFDSKRLATVLSLYTHLEDGSGQYGIQGREAFESGIKVPMGFSSLIDAPTTYKISIDRLEGELLEGATVYLMDNATQQLHNLTETPYSFQSNEGTFHNRFTILFEEAPVLSIAELDRSIGLYPNPSKGLLHIQSGFAPIESIQLYDLQGRLVEQRDGALSQQIEWNLSSLQPALYLVRIQTEAGTVSKRLIKN